MSTPPPSAERATLLVMHLAAGGPHGYGHLSRCCAIAAAATAWGWDTAFVVETSERPASAALQRRLPPGAHIATDRAAALVARAELVAGVERSVVACDLPERVVPGHDRGHVAGTECTVLLNGDPLDLAPADLVFLRGPAPTDAPLPANVLAGFAYEIVRPEIHALRPAAPWHRDRVEHILVSFGGSDPGHQTEAFLAGLDGAALADLQVVVGPGFDAERVAAIEAGAAGRYTCITKPDAFADALATTDLFVTMGGQSAIEALHLGRPVAAIRWGTLAADIDWLADAGLLADLGDAPHAASALADFVGQPDVLARLASAGWNTIDGLGAARSIDAIAAVLPDGR